MIVALICISLGFSMGFGLCFLFWGIERKQKGIK